MNLSIIVLAAGKGTRMKSEKPKVFHEVGNYPMIHHVLKTATELNPKQIITIVSKNFNHYSNILKESFNKIEYIIQKNQLGTADAVKFAFQSPNYAKSNISLILFGDTPLVAKTTLKKALVKFNSMNLDLCVLSMKPKNENNSYGKLVIKNKKLEQIIEFKDANSEQKKIKLCNSGIMIVKTNLLISNLDKTNNKNKKKEFYLTDLVNIFTKQNLKVDHFECDNRETLGVNDKNDLCLVEKEFQSLARKKFLNCGVTITDPNSVFFSLDTEIGKDVTIFPNVVIGKNVKIGNNVKIKSFSHIENSEIKKNVEIGPFARTRDQVIIHEGVKIGNFVEIKKSVIKKEVKISHLSYIGDAEIGEFTNIGAGSITCNFDGKNKNKTIISENCFIGSNTSLIAPIKIEKNSIIGASTVIDKNISPGTVVYRKSELIKKQKK